MNKPSTFAAVFLLILARGLLAQDCATCRGSNSLSLTTGLDTSGTLMPMPSTATGGVVDPYWQLINVAPPSANGSGGINIPNAYTIQFGSAAYSDPTWLNLPGADALSVIPNHQFPTNNSVASQPWRFLRKFYLCQNTSVHFVVDHIGDDQDTVKIFDSNGTLLFTDTGLGWGTVKHFDTSLDMHAGCCYMTVELVNIGAVLTGFSVKADLSVANSSLSNPSEACCATSVVSGQKIIDANCDGLYEKGEPPGVGWTIKLLSGSSVVQTATTDANGEFTFYNVPNGNYTLQEVAQSGYVPGTPASGQFAVTISAANSVKNFQFLNCPAPPPTPTPVPCAQVTDKGIRCEPGGSYSYTFSVMNSTGNEVPKVLLTPVAGHPFTLSQQLFNLAPPLHDGQSATLGVKIRNVKPGAKVCFFVTLMPKKASCCTIKVCLTLPTCGDGNRPTPRRR